MREGERDNYRWAQRERGRGEEREGGKIERGGTCSKLTDLIHINYI